MGTLIFDPVTLTLSLTHFIKTFTFLITFEQWVLELWYFTWVFHVIRLFPGYHYSLPCNLDLEVWPIFKNFNLGNNFWTMSTRVWYFTWELLVIIPFPNYHYFLPRDLDLGVLPIFKKNFKLITFEQWVLELWYFTWVSLVIRPFRGLHYFDLVTLTWEFDILLKKINLAYNFWIVGVRALIFHTNVPCDEIFL